MPFPKMTKTDFKKNAVKMVMLAQIVAGFTPTTKDDQFVELINGLINDPDQFDKLCELLGIVD